MVVIEGVRSRMGLLIYGKELFWGKGNREFLKSFKDGRELDLSLFREYCGLCGDLIRGGI